MDNKVISIQGITGIRERRLFRFLFNPPPLSLPVALPPVPLSGFAARLARHPVDLVTHLGMVRANAYFAAGCPVALCDHAAARDLWAVIHADAISPNQN
jgi:hypothetical protein